MNVVSLIYHDVTPVGEEASSGLPGQGAALYKLTPELFENHLLSLSDVGADCRQTWPDLASVSTGNAVLLTFDDGGSSAYHRIAPLLEKHGWKGHFFVSSDFIGTPGFLDEDQVRALAEAGHVIGSHSGSHPARFSALAPIEQRNEWQRSANRLRQILGASVTLASVPGGYFRPEVARIAKEAGIESLFTSEPRPGDWQAHGCRVFGRYSVQRTTHASEISDLVWGRGCRRERQRATWELKKVAKTVGGDRYTQARRTWLQWTQRGKNQ